MFKYLLVVLILFYQPQGYVSAQSYTTVPILGNPDKHNCSKNAEEVEKKFIIAMNGNNTYHVDQVIFYLNDQKSKQYPVDYIFTPGIGVHKLHTHDYTWNEARYACTRKQETGHLAVINSDAEEKLFLGMLKDKNIDGAWLGLHDQFQEGDWVTIHDVALENTGYNKWTTKWAPIINPDNAGGRQNCAYLLREYPGMDDYQCDIRMPFICEVPV